jgi:hypothetical protein
MQGWPETLRCRAPFSRQSRSDRSHFAAPLTGLTRGQCRLRRSDCSATRQSELTAAKSGLGRHRKLRLARPQGSDSASVPEDDELRIARPQGSDSAPKDDELHIARP